MSRVLPRLEPGEGVVPHSVELRVRFGETDAAAVVFHGNYLRYFEVGRVEMLRAHGVSFAELIASGLFMPVVDAWCSYHRPARYDDLLRIETWVDSRRRSTVTVGNRVWRGAELLASGGVRLACIDSETGRPRALPEEVASLESGPEGHVVEGD